MLSFHIQFQNLLVFIIIKPLNVNDTQELGTIDGSCCLASYGVFPLRSVSNSPKEMTSLWFIALDYLQNMISWESSQTASASIDSSQILDETSKELFSSLGQRRASAFDWEIIDFKKQKLH